MDVFLKYLAVFALGGLLCVPAEILICKTKLTPARILTGYVVAGVIIGAIGLYEPLINTFGSGARVPLTGFGAALAKGVFDAVNEKGAFGIISGGVAAMAPGLTAAIVISLISALLFKSKRI